MAQHEERCDGCGDVVDEAEHCAYCGNAFCTACWQDTTEAGPVCFGCAAARKVKALESENAMLRKLFARPISTIIGHATQQKCRACDGTWWLGEDEYHYRGCVCERKSV